MPLDSRSKDLMKIGDSLFSKKAPIDQLNQELAEQFYPERADFTTTHSWGAEFGASQVTSYPSVARRELANLHQAMLRPDSGDWFTAHAMDDYVDEGHENRAYLEWMGDTMRRAMYDPLSGFVRATKEADHDWVLCGGPIIEVDAYAGSRGWQMLYRCGHPRDHAFMENYAGEVDHMHARKKLDARTLKKLFPTKVSREINEAAQKEPDKEFNCRRIVIPRDQYDGLRGSPKAAFVSLYIDADHETLLEERPILWFPYVCPRWKRLPGIQYGVSPATLPSLPEARTLQAISMTLLEAGEKAVDPPMTARAGAIREDIAMQTRGITWVDEEYDERMGAAIRPLMDGSPGLPYGFEMREQLRAMIADGMFLSKLMLPPIGTDMTAYETRKRLEEHIRQVMPILSPAEDEYNSKLCDTTFEAMRQMKAFGPDEAIPEDLRGSDVRFVFSSPVRAVQEEVKGQKFMEGLTILKAAMEFDPAQRANLNPTKATRSALQGVGWEADWLAPEKAVDEERARMAEAAKMAAGTEALGSVAEIANKGASAVKQLSQAA